MSLALLKSDDLRRAAEQAAQGAPDRFLRMLAFHSGLPGPKPNLRLAEVVGEALAGEPRCAGAVQKMFEDVAAPDTAETFLPIVAAHVYAAQIGRGLDPRPALANLRELSADERAPVRQGTEHALRLLAKRGHSDVLVTALADWLAHDKRDVRWGAAATMLDALAAERSTDGLTKRTELLETIAWLVADVADAPRAAERSDGRRRVLVALANVGATIAATFRTQPDGAEWLRAQMEGAHHPDVRRSWTDAIELMKKRGGAEKASTLSELGDALASSAKPDRHAARRVEGMTSRGKRRQHRGR